MADDDTGSTGSGSTEKTFTQAEVDKLIRDRLARERGKYADYDDLKAKAAEADKGKTQIDRIEAQLAEMTKQAEKNAREVLIRDVADELGISVKQAKRLSGSTREELLADGREFLEEFKPNAAGKDGKSDENGSEGTDNGSGSEGGSGGSATGNGDTAKSGESQGRRGRPQEALRSGAPISGGAEEMDPLKLAALVPRR